MCVNLFFTGDLAEESFGPPQYSEESLIAASFHQVKNRYSVYLIMFTKTFIRRNLIEELGCQKIDFMVENEKEKD